MSCYTCKWLWTKHQLCVSHRWCRHAYSWDQVDVSVCSRAPLRPTFLTKSHHFNNTFSNLFYQGNNDQSKQYYFIYYNLFCCFILFLKVANLFTLFYPFAWSNRIRKWTVRGKICTGKTLMTRAGLETGTFGTTHARKRRSSKLSIKLA